MAKIKALEPSKIRMSMSRVYLFIIVGTLLMSISAYYLIFAAELYTPGLGGIINGFVYTMGDIINPEHLARFKAMSYWFLFIIANIPIMYMTTRWFSKKFFKLSMIQMGIGFAMAIFFSTVPGFANAIIWGTTAGHVNTIADASTVDILFVSLIAGFAYGMGVGMIFRVGACTMGLDPVIRYISRVKEQNISTLLFAVTIVNSIVWIFIRYFTNPDMANVGFIQGTFLNPSFLGSWLFVGAYSYTAGAMYSTTKKVQLMIGSKKIEEISDYFNKEKYHRGHTLFEVQGGYSKTQTHNLQMIINYEELNDVVVKIAAIDGEAFITVHDIRKVYDVRSWIPMTEEDIERAKEIAIKDKDRKERMAKARSKYRKQKEAKIEEDKEKAA